MDRRERVDNESEVMKMALEWKQSRIWTALPGIVVRYPGSAGNKLTVDIQPTIKGVLTDPKGSNTFIKMPVLMDCPLLFQGGGGVTATFPVVAGDECLVIFSSRAIDNWFVSGGLQNPSELRMHNLSDGFALVGVRSLPRAFTLDQSNACLVTDDGQTYFKLNPSSKAIAVQATGGINLNGVTIDSNGNLNSPATISATTDVTTGSISLKSHKTTGVQPGSGLSGVPQ